MSFPFHVECKQCGRHMGTIVSHEADPLTVLGLEFACPECIEKIARSQAITLDSETSWGRVIAQIKGRM